MTCLEVGFHLGFNTGEKKKKSFDAKLLDPDRRKEDKRDVSSSKESCSKVII